MNVVWDVFVMIKDLLFVNFVKEMIPSILMKEIFKYYSNTKQKHSKQKSKLHQK